jgi:hypothetical protein
MNLAPHPNAHMMVYKLRAYAGVLWWYKEIPYRTFEAAFKVGGPHIQAAVNGHVYDWDKRDIHHPHSVKIIGV